MCQRHGAVICGAALNGYLHVFKRIALVVSLIPSVTGLAMVPKGFCCHRSMGAEIPDWICEEPLLGSQVRFAWTVLFNYALLMLLFI